MKELRTFRGGPSSRIIRTSLRQSGEISDQLKKLIDGRDNDDIISYLESQRSSNFQEYKVRGGVIIKKRENFGVFSKIGLTPPPVGYFRLFEF